LSAEFDNFSSVWWAIMIIIMITMKICSVWWKRQIYRLQ
jgi:hypothetical protein